MNLTPLLALTVFSAALAAPDRLPPFTHSAPLVLEGKGAIYALNLPAEIYRGIARRDLGDLRVLNGAGEVVPHALERQPGSEKKTGSAVALAFFPLRAPAGRPLEDLRLSVERRPDGTLKAAIATDGRRAPEARVAGYLIDASTASNPIRELRFAWEAGPEGGSVDVRIEASDDLRSWRAAGSGPLIVLRRGDALLERRAIEISPLRAKYLRLSWRAEQSDPRFTGIVAQAVDAAADTPREWLRVEGVAGAKAGEYAFELPPGLPVDRLRFDLPQENTVVAATLIAQERPASAERILASAVLYRMEQGGQKLANPDLPIAPPGAKRWLLRVDARGGGLGSGMPVLQAGWVPHRLVFVARGEAPFQAVFGNPDAVSGAMPIASIVPGHSTDKPVPALHATLGPVKSMQIQEQTPVVAARDYIEQMDRKKLWLWGSLLLAVLVIVGMAWRLTREMPAPGEPAKPRPPGEVR